MNREEALKSVPRIATEALPMRVAVKLNSVELLAHAIHVRWPITLDEARALNQKGWSLPYYAEETGKIFPGKGDSVYSDGSLRQAYQLAEEWVSQNEQ